MFYLQVKKSIFNYYVAAKQLTTIVPENQISEIGSYVFGILTAILVCAHLFILVLRKS